MYMCMCICVAGEEGIRSRRIRSCSILFPAAGGFLCVMCVYSVCEKRLNSSIRTAGDLLLQKCASSQSSFFLLPVSCSPSSSSSSSSSPSSSIGFCPDRLLSGSDFVSSFLLETTHGDWNKRREGEGKKVTRNERQGIRFLTHTIDHTKHCLIPGNQALDVAVCMYESCMCCCLLLVQMCESREGERDLCSRRQKRLAVVREKREANGWQAFFAPSYDPVNLI